MFLGCNNKTQHDFSRLLQSSPHLVIQSTCSQTLLPNRPPFFLLLPVHSSNPFHHDHMLNFPLCAASHDQDSLKHLQLNRRHHLHKTSSIRHLDGSFASSAPTAARWLKLHTLNVPLAVTQEPDCFFHKLGSNFVLHLQLRSLFSI